MSCCCSTSGSSSLAPADRLKQYFRCPCCLRLSSPIPECQHSGGRLPRKRIILLQRRAECSIKSSSTKAALMWASCPLLPRRTFKVTLGASSCTFNKILLAHYMDGFFPLATRLKWKTCTAGSMCEFCRWTQNSAWVKKSWSPQRRKALNTNIIKWLNEISLVQIKVYPFW